MYLLATNMDKTDFPYDVENVFILKHIRKRREIKESLDWILTVYYTFYNHKHLNLGIYTNKKFRELNEYIIIKKHIDYIDNLHSSINWGYKSMSNDFDTKDMISLKDRLLSKEEISDRVNNLINTKYVNELNW